MNYEVLYNKNQKVSNINGETIKDLLTLTYIKPDMFSYSMFKVPAEYIARMDLICLDQYGDARYADVICKLNGISNPYELNAGQILILPNPGIINQFYYRSDDIDINSENDTEKPQPKTKKEKRKANEAVIGDKRFRIDKQNGLVIY